MTGMTPPGRRPVSTGTYYVTRGDECLDPEEITLAEIMKDHGYTTGNFSWKSIPLWSS